MTRCLTLVATSIISVAAYKFVENGVRNLSADNLCGLPNLSNYSKIKQSEIFKTARKNYEKMGGCSSAYNYYCMCSIPVTLTNKDREDIASDCIDFLFTPVTRIIGQYNTDDGRIRNNERVILSDGTVTDEYDDHLVHINNLTMNFLDITDCVNYRHLLFDTPSDVKKKCLPKINHLPKSK